MLPDRDSAVDAGLQTARHYADGGMTLPWRALREQALTEGPLLSPVAGRTDHIPLSVSAGSYIIPADVVSGLGEGNTLTGSRVLQTMFASQPYDQAEPHALRGGRRSVPEPHMKRGGPVPIMAAGGGYVVPPDAVARVGGGDVNRGHRILDAFVKHVRNKTIKTLRKLPGPVKK